MYKNVYNNNVITKKRFQVALTKEVFSRRHHGAIRLPSVINYMRPYK